MQPSQPPAGPQGPALPGRRLPQGPGAPRTPPHWPPAAPSHLPEIPSPVRQGGCAPSLVPRGRCFGPACGVSEWRRGGHTPHHASAALWAADLAQTSHSTGPCATAQAAPASWEALGQAGAQQRRPAPQPLSGSLPAISWDLEVPAPTCPGPGPEVATASRHRCRRGNSPLPGRRALPPPAGGAPPCQECARGRGRGAGA